MMMLLEGDKGYREKIKRSKVGGLGSNEQGMLKVIVFDMYLKFGEQLQGYLKKLLDYRFKDGICL